MKSRVEILIETDMIGTGRRALSKKRDYKLTDRKGHFFEELMKYHKKVFLICLGFSRNAPDAQDLAQEVYLKAYKNIDTLTEIARARFWLFRIARNTCLNFLKKHRLDQVSAFEITQQVEDSPTPESDMIYREKLFELKKAIRMLSKKQRDVFVLKEYGDLSYQEIAETLGIELGTVMSRLNRARQAIKEKIEGEKNV